MFEHPDYVHVAAGTIREKVRRMIASRNARNEVVAIVSINCTLTPQPHHLMDARRLALLQPHAVLVNTARGEVIDEEALAAALKARAFAGAGLDVFEHEPAVHPDLIGLPNVVLLPHMGSATIEGRIDMGEKVIINIKTWVDGHNPPDRVLPSML